MEEKQRIEEDLDGDVLASLSKIPPRRKVHSYSQQLDGSTSSTGMVKRNQIRKHSLDEDRIPKNIERYYDSSDDEGCYPNSSSTTSASGGASSINCISSFSGGPGSCTERHEYMNQLLEMKQTNDSCSGGNEERRMDNRPLPEFIANGGGKGIFKVPVRAPEHPGRPPSLELRPHPLRETQIGSFIRVIACTKNQLWAGQECGVRFWNFTDIYKPGCRIEGMVKKGDEDAAPFYQSTQTPPTNCFIVDEANKLVWSGHKDGKIRSWKMDQTLDGNAFKEGLSWNAHRGPVLSMVMDSYGDLWSGSEGGIVKVWPWETIEKSLSLSAEERHMAALLVERSFIDLKSKVTVNGVCSISASDVKYLLSDYSRAKIWSAGYLSFALWDARTRELLKVFNMDGQIENRADMSSGNDLPIEEEMKVKLVSTSKKEKSQGGLSFFQRSRNALMGAADAVRRVAAKGGLVEDNKRTEALVMTMDGMIWTGCSNGYLVQWDGNGNRLQDFNHHHFAVQCLCTFGARIWVGYANGTVQVLDLEGNLIGGWIAHSCPVIRMTFGAGYVFTLANHGGIRGWNMASPFPLDNILRSELASKELLHMRRENLKILVGTWNVGQGRASLDALRLWLGSAASEVGVVVVGLQEVEMGAGFLAMSAARETVGLEGSSIGQWWMDAIGRSLDEGKTFDRVGSRQLAGLLIAVWVRSTLRPQVGDIDAAAVPCGFGRAIGNKGGVGVRMRAYDRKICFVNCHLAAHLEAVTRRNADFDHIFKNMIFNRPSNLLNAAASGVSSAVQMLRGANAVGIHCEDGRPELSEADMVVFLGDFNYRLHGISYDEARDFVSQRCFDWLRERDQLRAEMKAGRVFQGMREGLILFPPTYKFERHQPGLGGYDSGEKKRIPAWCDRIIYRDNRDNHPAAVYECNLSCPVISSILLYEAIMDVTDSDHKPVRCMYNVDVARVDESLRRQEFGEIIQSNETIKSLIKKSRYVPDIALSSENIFLQNQNRFVLQITNRSEDTATFEIYCEGQSTIKEDGQGSEHCPRGTFGFPRWLEVTPAVGVLLPGKVAEVSIQHKDSITLEDFVDGTPQNWWAAEDAKDKEVTLILRGRGSCSTAPTTQRILVHHSSSSAKPINFDTANDLPLE